MEDTQKSFKLDVSLFVGVSILAHAVLMAIYVPEVGIYDALKNKDKPLKIKILNQFAQSKNKPKQVVETSENRNKVKPRDAKFLGKTNTNFERQTKAAKVGSFKRAGVGTKNGFKETASKQKAKKMNKTKKKVRFSDLAMTDSFAPKKEYQASTGARLGLSNGDVKSKGLSQSSDYVKDIPLGDFTKLNTQEFEFYGFYHRIRQKLEQFWGRNLQSQADKIFKSGRSIASDKNHVTSLIISLDKSGDIIGVNIKSTSGVKELDDAAVDAFNDAGPFPNPPSKMIKNGVATIEWSFVVNS
jgi:TonB family protein